MEKKDIQRIEFALDEGRESLMREISIVLDNYDDIFSDFDPRQYWRRELSEDFLKELSRRYLEDSKGNFEVRFFIPAYERDPKAETVIKKRLRGHFLLEAKRVQKEVEGIRNKAMVYIAAGVGVLLIETLVTLFAQNDILPKLAGILTLPVGWFLVWTGTERILDFSPSIMKQVHIYEKFAKCNYLFISEDKE